MNNQLEGMRQHADPDNTRIEGLGEARTIISEIEQVRVTSPSGARCTTALRYQKGCFAGRTCACLSNPQLLPRGYLSRVLSFPVAACRRGPSSPSSSA